MKNWMFIFFLLFYFVGNLCAEEKQYEIDVETTLNVRAAPDANAEVLYTLSDGTIVSPILIENGWAEIIKNGQKGYISTKFIRELYSDKGHLVSSEKWNFKKWFSNLVSLKVCYGIIVVLIILNWFFSVAVPRNELLGIRCSLFLALLVMIILCYFGQRMEDLVNHNWTGGWLNGYFLAFVNAVVLGSSVVQLYNSYIGCTAAAARKAIEDSDVQFCDLNIKFFFWFLPLAPIPFLILLIVIHFRVLPYWVTGVVGVALLVYMAGVFIKNAIRNYRLIWPHYWIATFITFSGIATMVSIVIMIYVSILMLLLGVLVSGFVMGLLKTAPGTVAEYMSESPSSETGERQMEEERNEGEISWDKEWIEKNGRPDARIVEVESDGTVRDSDGERWRVDDAFGKRYKKV